MFNLTVDLRVWSGGGVGVFFSSIIIIIVIIIIISTFLSKFSLLFTYYFPSLILI